VKYLITGGAGFIGAALVRRLVATGADVLNVDALTYAGDLRRVAECVGRPNYRFLHADIADRAAMDAAIAGFQPDAVLNLAAESHVDRSIDSPESFVRTNVTGAYVMLEASLEWLRREKRALDTFRFVQVSTDEVFGSLQPDDVAFCETTPYDPSSPYSASKAAADHLAAAWRRTYGLPVIITNCSNNYGPYQHREKLIPTVIGAALAGAPAPIYGTGENIRDWLHVEDHVTGLIAAVARGRAGGRYLFGGSAERTNLDLVRAICAVLDRLAPKAFGSYAEQISFVTDRPGHDLRYAVDPSHAQTELGWRAAHTLERGLEQTVGWYLANPEWRAAPERLGVSRATG
jgi:dTDP-glucose 4,6-dehydratase